jgi:putative flavoprotein involved in K+ transport
VTRLRPIESGDGRGGRITVSTSGGDLEARDVVVAAGPFGRPNVPAVAAGLDPSILSLHSNDYRHPGQLPAGGVLLVGSGQTGVQLAEELHAAGRSVTMSAGRCGAVPRWYRGKDVFWWLRQLGTRGRDVGTPLPTPDSLPSPAARFACNPQLSGHGGGHTVSLRRMAAGGIRLAGRLEGFDGRRAIFRADLNENLGFSEHFFVERFKRAFDTFAERVGEALPPPDEQEPLGFDVAELTELDLAAEGIGTVIWTSGFRPALDWLDLPVLDAFGLPVTEAGQTSIPGLSFIGTPWLVDMGSANLVGVARDAEALVRRIVDPVAA